MARVTQADRAKFFEQVDQASRKAVWCALASVEDGVPRVRLVHPTGRATCSGSRRRY